MLRDVYLYKAVPTYVRGQHQTFHLKLKIRKSLPQLLLAEAKTSARETRRLVVIYDAKHVRKNTGAILKKNGSAHAK